MPVPTHLFKVIKMIRSNGVTASSGFIVPNAKCKTASDPLDFKTDLEKIEKAAGLDLSGLKADEELCESTGARVECCMSAEDRITNWRLAWRVKVADTIQEVRSAVRVAIKRKYFNKNNLNLVYFAVERAKELCDTDDILDALTPLDCKKSLKYRDALKDALSLFEDD
jgi:hypothetical protein